MVLYFVDNYIRNGGEMPDKMVEENIRVDYNKLRMLIRKDKEFAHDASTIQTLVQQGYITGELKTGFPAETIAEPDNFISLLFYFGMLTISGTKRGKTLLTIPNQVVREQLYSYLLDTYNEADLRFDNWEKGNWHPLWLIVATGKPTSTISPNVCTDILPSATSKRRSIRTWIYVGYDRTEPFLSPYLRTGESGRICRHLHVSLTGYL